MYWICESCLQLPEDEESVPPILHYNNHMANKDVWVSFELSRQQSAGHGVMPFPHQTHNRGSSCAGVTCAALCVLSEAADPNFWIQHLLCLEFLLVVYSIFIADLVMNAVWSWHLGAQILSAIFRHDSDSDVTHICRLLMGAFPQRSYTWCSSMWPCSSRNSSLLSKLK